MSTPANAGDPRFLFAAGRQIDEGPQRRADPFNGHAAVVGVVLAVLSEALTGQGILHQIGLANLLRQG